MKLFKALLDVPGFNTVTTIGSVADEFSMSDPRPQFDQERLMSAFPGSWADATDDELMAMAEQGLKDVQSPQFHQMTAAEVVKGIRKRLNYLEIQKTYRNE